MTRRANPSGPTRQKPTRRSRYPKLWTLQDPEPLGLVFQAFEDLTTLRQRCAREVASAREEERLFGHLFQNVDQSGFQRWSRVSERVTTSWSLLDDSVRTNRFDSAQFQEAYRQMWSVRTVWLGLESQPGSLALIDRVIDHLRQLLICYAQAQGHRRRPQP